MNYFCRPAVFLSFLLFFSSSKLLSQEVIEKEALLQSKVYASRPGSLGIIGDTTDITTKTTPGTVLMGGGKDVDAAFAWMLQKSGGGNVVIIRTPAPTLIIRIYIS